MSLIGKMLYAQEKITEIWKSPTGVADVKQRHVTILGSRY